MTLDLNLTNIQVENALSRSLNAAKSVLDYGVDNSGASDCTTAFAAAIAANAGKTLHVPMGTYQLSEGATAGTCLSIVDSIALVMDPEAVLKLATDQQVPLIMIGDNSSAFSNVTIVGGRLDGDGANSTTTPKVRTSLIEVRGPVTDVLVADMPIGNANIGAVEISGTDTTNRAERVFFERCPIDNVTEGVVIQFTNEFHWRGGDISNMTMQDCFEPHGGIYGWSLRDCTISGADPTNSEVEIFPQVGDILHGVVENVRIKGELRISVASPDANKVEDLTIRSSVFENGLIYAGILDGHYYRVEVDDCEFIGPASNVPRGVPTTYKSAIHAGGVDNRMNLRNSRIHDYEGCGVIIECDDTKIVSNDVGNNGQAGALLSGYLRAGIFATGDRALVMGNHCYDDQATKTQIYTPQIRGDNARIIGNRFTDAETLTRNLGAGWVASGNSGDIQDALDAYATIPNNQSWVTLDQTKFPGLSSSGSTNFKYRVQITPMGDYSPATRFWAYVGAGQWRVQMDAVPTNPVTFHIQASVQSEQVDAAL